MKRKFLAAFSLLAAVSLSAVLGGTALKMSVEAAHFRGDVNEDGIVNVLDFINLKQILLGTAENSDEPSRYVTVNNLKLDYEIYKLGSLDSETYDKQDVMAVISSSEELDELLKKAEAEKDILSRSEPDFRKNVYLFFTHNGSADETPVLNTTLFDDSELEIVVNTFKSTPVKYLFGVEIPKEIYDNWHISIFEKDLMPAATIPPCTSATDEPFPFPETSVVYIDNDYKPVIYLYPEETTDINVKLHLNNSGKLTFTYPEYNDDKGWNVKAEPDSVLHDASGRQYSYLFWEGVSGTKWDMSRGFVVKGSDTVSFLQEKLEYLGLTPKEYNEFIVYWAPKMQDNRYNLISFQTDQYEEYAELEITPEPDSIQRVFMTYQALDEYKEIPEQKLKAFERHGYTVIEWGGTEVTGNKVK